MLECLGVQDVEVIEDPAAAVVALDPIRARLLAALAEPASAATLAGAVGLTRQKVNYHLRALEAHGLVEVAEERRWGGLTERLLVATAASYVISPGALGAAAADPRTAGPPVRPLPDRDRRPDRPRGRPARPPRRGRDALASTPSSAYATRRRSPRTSRGWSPSWSPATTTRAASPTGCSPPPHPKPEEDAMTDRNEKEIEVPGTPEQVWEAIATGPGITAWFMPAEVDPGRRRSPSTTPRT